VGVGFLVTLQDARAAVQRSTGDHWVIWLLKLTCLHLSVYRSGQWWRFIRKVNVQVMLKTLWLTSQISDSPCPKLWLRTMYLHFFCSDCDMAGSLAQSLSGRVLLREVWL